MRFKGKKEKGNKREEYCEEGVVSQFGVSAVEGGSAHAEVSHSHAR